MPAVAIVVGNRINGAAREVRAGHLPSVALARRTKDEQSFIGTCKDQYVSVLDRNVLHPAKIDRPWSDQVALFAAHDGSGLQRLQHSANFARSLKSQCRILGETAL